MMTPVQVGGNDKFRQQLFITKFNVGMMEENEKQLDGFHR
jgi:hypothetical protein